MSVKSGKIGKIGKIGNSEKIYFFIMTLLTSKTLYVILDLTKRNKKEAKMTYQDIPEIEGYNSAVEYNAYYTNTLENQIAKAGGKVLEKNENNPHTPATELKYQIGDQTKYAYIMPIGAMSEAPGEKSIVTTRRIDHKRVNEIFEILEQKEREQMRI